MGDWVEWVDDKPPAHYGKWVRLVDELRKQPGRWALAELSKTSTRARSVARHLATYEVECEVQKQDNGSGWAVYVREPKP